MFIQNQSIFNIHAKTYYHKKVGYMAIKIEQQNRDQGIDNIENIRTWNWIQDIGIIGRDDDIIKNKRRSITYILHIIGNKCA